MPSPFMTPYASRLRLEPYDYGPTMRIADLMQEGGRQRAEAILRRGDIWAGLLQQLGQIPQQVQQMKLAEEERGARAEERRAMADYRQQQTEGLRQQQETQQRRQSLFSSGATRNQVLESLRAAGDLEGFEKASKHFDAVEANSRRLYGSFAAGIREFGDSPEAVQIVGAHMKELGFSDETVQPIVQRLTQDPTQITPTVDFFLRESPDESHRKLLEPKKLIPVAPGTALIDPETKQPVFTAPAKPEKAPDVGSFADFVVRKYGASPTPEQITTARGEYGRADDKQRDPLAEELAQIRIAEAKAKAEAKGTRGQVIADAWASGKAFPSTQEATTEALQSFKERGIEPPRKLGIAQQQEATRTSEAIATIEDVEAAYQRVKGKVGPVTYAFNEFQQKVPGLSADPDFVTFNTLLRGMGNLEIKRITGAQMSEAEADRLLKGMATGSLRPGEFEAALKVMKRNAKRSQDILLYGQVRPTTEKPDPGGIR